MKTYQNGKPERRLLVVTDMLADGLVDAFRAYGITACCATTEEALRMPRLGENAAQFDAVLYMQGRSSYASGNIAKLRQRYPDQILTVTATPQFLLTHSAELNQTNAARFHASTSIVHVAHFVNGR